MISTVFNPCARLAKELRLSSRSEAGQEFLYRGAIALKVPLIPLEYHAKDRETAIREKVVQAAVGKPGPRVSVQLRVDVRSLVGLRRRGGQLRAAQTSAA